MLPTTINEGKNSRDGQLDVVWHARQFVKGGLLLGISLIGYMSMRTWWTGQSIAPLTMNGNNLERRTLDDTHMVCIDFPQVGPFQLTTQQENSRLNIESFSDQNYIAIWENRNNPINSNIFGQYYDETFAPASDIFPVNTYTNGDQKFPTLAVTQDKRVLTLWQSNGQTGAYGIYGQFYDAEGNELGNEFRVNTNTNGNFWYPGITAQANTFFSVWNSDQQGTRGQLFDANATRIGSELQISTDATGTKERAGAFTLSNNQMITFWQHFDSSTGYDIRARRSDAQGVGIGNEFTVNTVLTGQQVSPHGIALNNGFVFVWSGNQAVTNYNIYGQLYNLAGDRVGNEFQINTFRARDQQYPKVKSFQQGQRFVVAWQSTQDTVPTQKLIRAQRFEANGVPLGEEFLAYTNTVRDQLLPNVAAGPGTGFTLFWEQDTTFHGQRYFTDIFVAQACNGNYTEGFAYPLNLFMGPLADPTPTIDATLTLSPSSAGKLVNTTYSPAALANYDSVTGTWHATGSVEGVQIFIQGMQFVPTQYSYQTAQLGLSVSANSNILPFNADFTLTGIAVDDPPTLPGIYLPVTQGQTVVLNKQHIPVEDVDTPPEQVILHVQEVSQAMVVLCAQPNSPILSFTEAQLEANLACYIPNGGQQEPTLTLVATDGLSTTDPVSREGTFTVLLNITNNDIPLNQGERKLITTALLSASNPQNNANTVMFTISNIQHAHFEYSSRPNEEIITFSLADIQASRVYLVADGSTDQATFNVMVKQSNLYTQTTAGNVDFNILPYFVRNNVKIEALNELVPLTEDNIYAVDPDGDSSALVINVKFADKAHFAYTGATDEEIYNFIQSQVNSILFAYGNSGEKPSYTLTVSDGLGTSADSNGDVTFNVKNDDKRNIEDTTEFKVSFTIASIAASTLVSYLFWEYKKHKDAKQRREKSPLGNLIRTALKLDDIKDFESKKGTAFVEAINLIIKELNDAHQIDVTSMTEDELSKFSVHVVDALKTKYVIYPVTSSNSNLCVRAYQQYQQKTLLKTDEVKKEIVTIAAAIQVAHAAELALMSMTVTTPATSASINSNSNLNAPLLGGGATTTNKSFLTKLKACCK